MSNAPERIHLRNGEVNKGQVSPFDDCYIRRDAITPAMAAEALLSRKDVLWDHFHGKGCISVVHDALTAITAQGEEQ